MAEPARDTFRVPVVTSVNSLPPVTEDTEAGHVVYVYLHHADSSSSTSEERRAEPPVPKTSGAFRQFVKGLRQRRDAIAECSRCHMRQVSFSSSRCSKCGGNLKRRFG